MKAFFNRDLELAYKFSSTKKEALLDCDEFSKKHGNKWLVEDTIDKIKQMLADIHDIDKTVYMFLEPPEEKAE